MKILVTSTGTDMDAAIDPRFGRSPYFAIVDTGSDDLEAVANPYLDAAGGAGTQAAQWLLKQDVDVLVTGRCGPKASAVLDGSGVQVIEGAAGSVRDAVDRLAATPASSTEAGSTAETSSARRGGFGRGPCGAASAGMAGPRGGGRGQGAGRGQGHRRRGRG